MTAVQPIPTNPLFQDLTGRTFGRWSVLGFAGMTGKRKARWLCRCSCGEQRVITGYTMTNGTSTGCGCRVRDRWTPEQLEARKKVYQARHRAKNRARRAAQLKVWRADNPALVAGLKRADNYRNKYGLTIEGAEALLASQGGCCAICRDEIRLGGKAGAKIDHCHETDRVRGVICNRCNIALGCFRDDVTILGAAIAYLRASREEGESDART